MHSACMYGNAEGINSKKTSQLKKRFEVLASSVANMAEEEANLEYDCTPSRSQ